MGPWERVLPAGTLGEGACHGDPGTGCSITRPQLGQSPAASPLPFLAAPQPLGNQAASFCQGDPPTTVSQPSPPVPLRRLAAASFPPSFPSTVSCDEGPSTLPYRGRIIFHPCKALLFSSGNDRNSSVIPPPLRSQVFSSCEGTSKGSVRHTGPTLLNTDLGLCPFSP